MINSKLPEYYKINDGQIWLVEDERENMKLYYRVKEIISSKKSKFQNVDIIDTYDFGRCLVLDGVIQSTEKDGYIYNEMITHIPLAIHKNAKKVLVIGGGDCGAVNEIRKYEYIEKIDMVEIDELVVRECIKHIPVLSKGVDKDRRVNFVFDDGVKYVKKSNTKYDIIIVDSSDPIGPAVELFSKNFYYNINKILSEDGLMVCQSQSPFFHKDIFRSIYKKLELIYPIVKIYKSVTPSYPGGMWSFMIASKLYDVKNSIEDNEFPENAKYINNEIYKSCFLLSNYIKNIFK